MIAPSSTARCSGGPKSSRVLNARKRWRSGPRRGSRRSRRNVPARILPPHRTIRRGVTDGGRRASQTRCFPHLAQGQAEEMVEDAIAIFRVGHGDALKAAVAAILPNRLFEETTQCLRTALRANTGDCRMRSSLHFEFLGKNLAQASCRAADQRSQGRIDGRKFFGPARPEQAERNLDHRSRQASVRQSRLHVRVEHAFAAYAMPGDVRSNGRDVIKVQRRFGCQRRRRTLEPAGLCQDGGSGFGKVGMGRPRDLSILGEGRHRGRALGLEAGIARRPEARAKRDHACGQGYGCAVQAARGGRQPVGRAWAGRASSMIPR